MKKLPLILALVTALGTTQVAHAEETPTTTTTTTTSCGQTTTPATTTPTTGTGSGGVSLMSDGGPCPKC